MRHQCLAQSWVKLPDWVITLVNIYVQYLGRQSHLRRVLKWLSRWGMLSTPWRYWVVISSPCFLMHHQISKVKIRHTTGDKWCTNHTAVFRSSVSRDDLAKICNKICVKSVKSLFITYHSLNWSCCHPHCVMRPDSKLNDFIKNQIQTELKCKIISKIIAMIIELSWEHIKKMWRNL